MQPGQLPILRCLSAPPACCALSPALPQLAWGRSPHARPPSAHRAGHGAAWLGAHAPAHPPTLSRPSPASTDPVHSLPCAGSCRVCWGLPGCSACVRSLPASLPGGRGCHWPAGGARWRRRLVERPARLAERALPLRPRTADPAGAACGHTRRPAPAQARVGGGSGASRGGGHGLGRWGAAATVGRPLRGAACRRDAPPVSNNASPWICLRHGDLSGGDAACRDYLSGCSPPARSLRCSQSVERRCRTQMGTGAAPKCGAAYKRKLM